jgi:hypothetical protein
LATLKGSRAHPSLSSSVSPRPDGVSGLGPGSRWASDHGPRTNLRCHGLRCHWGRRSLSSALSTAVNPGVSLRSCGAADRFILAYGSTYSHLLPHHVLGTKQDETKTRRQVAATFGVRLPLCMYNQPRPHTTSKDLYCRRSQLRQGGCLAVMTTVWGWMS